ncbi:hypothetical protein T05_7913 [Trichinella murrelli]|uniref:Uncharacterized protein n=1 Tax=Trichinella murrelli TaxID=144512 RepID=A0A0V0T4J3_9BILA|nr:hypothetical protein T05_7913 [Trichinella murrelli]
MQQSEATYNLESLLRELHWSLINIKQQQLFELTVQALQLIEEKNYQNTHCSKFIAMKLTETIVILVLSKSCTAQVATCKDDNNAAVDW